MSGGDLIFIDFEKELDAQTTREGSEIKVDDKAKESKAEKLKRLAKEIESGDYQVPLEDLAEILVDELSESSNEP